MPRRQPVFQLKITLQDVEPPIWRRLLVPGNMRLERLHEMFQQAMLWENAHLHTFRIDGREYGPDDEDAPEDQLDEFGVTIAEAVGDAGRFFYDYDFGDGWEHEVVVEEVTAWPWILKYAVCLGGARNCPPEDCGGPGGYARLLEVLADPKHPEHKDLAEWVGDDFDPERFPLALVNIGLQQIPTSR